MVWVHQYDYSTRRKGGTWTEPVVRYHNSVSTEEQALRAHERCKDVEYKWGREFEGIYGYRWENCRVVKRTTVEVVMEERIT